MCISFPILILFLPNNPHTYIHTYILTITSTTKQYKTHNYQPAFVFTDYENYSGFEDTSYVCALGILSSLFIFVGFDASAHMAEETIGSSVGAPQGIVMTVFATGVGGILYILALLYTTSVTKVFATDDDAGLHKNDVFFPPFFFNIT